MRSKRNRIPLRFRYFDTSEKIKLHLEKTKKEYFEEEEMKKKQKKKL
jgi:hypothetical protein